MHYFLRMSRVKLLQVASIFWQIMNRRLKSRLLQKHYYVLTVSLCKLSSSFPEILTRRVRTAQLPTQLQSVQRAILSDPQLRTLSES